MSIDIEIIPSKKIEIQWGILKSKIHSGIFQMCLTKETVSVISLFKLGENSPLNDEHTIIPGTYYSLELQDIISIAFSHAVNDEYTYEREFVQDYGRNLSEIDVAFLSNTWIKVGYSYALTTSGLVSIKARFFLLEIAKLLAEISDGWVVISNSDAFKEPVGVFRPSQINMSLSQFNDRWESRSQPYSNFS